ncbi:hypothetical protein SLE2022_033260 [Rubroshorea leprosula]
MGWGSIYYRRLKVFTMFVVICLDYRAVRQRVKWTSKSKRAALWGEAHKRNAKRFVSLMIDLKGVWVKLGQHLSTWEHMLPKQYIPLLRKLQDSLPPRPLKEVCCTIKKEMGKNIDDLFKDFVRDPLATASIAQVHRATLNNGHEVVVKVQHEGIKEIILEDLKSAKSIADWIMWLEPKFNLKPILEEWFVELPKELDFNNEAENTRKVSRNLGCKKCPRDNMSSNQVDVLIPEVIQSTERVLILEYMDGIRLSDSASLEAFGVDKQRIVEEITRAYAHQIFIDGFFNGDPHPGNFLVSKEAPHRPILLDFGFTKKISSSRKKELAKLILEPFKFDAIPADITIFARTLDLLRGLSPLDGSKVLFNILRSFAEVVLVRNIDKSIAASSQWIYNTPVHSDVEAKLRQLIVGLGDNGKILGMQVCAYKDGEVIIDTAAGVLGKYDPCPVQPDSLFTVFSVTKGFTAGMLHWLVDKGKLKLEENVANIWPEFGENGKELLKVHHVLNHTSGLHNALLDLIKENPFQLANWEECLNRIAMSVPETEPGLKQSYHYLSFGWICGGIIEHASGKNFQDVLEEAFIRPLNIEGELYIGIPPGVESRLATLTLDKDDLNLLSDMGSNNDLELPSTFQQEGIFQFAKILPFVFNMPYTRCAIIPAANGHCSARALARYYAALVDGGVVPPPHSSLSKPLLGSHPHIPKVVSEAEKVENKPNDNGSNRVVVNDACSSSSCSKNKSDSITITVDCDSHKDIHGKIFSNSKIHDQLLGVGEYGNLVFPNGLFGLGFHRFVSEDGSFTGFGHSGMGGSTGFCDIKNRFAIAVTLNQLSFGGVTKKIVQLVCSELNIPLPKEFAGSSENGERDSPLIN